MTVNGYEVPFWDVENVLNWLWQWLYNCVNTVKTIELYTLKRWIVWYVNYILTELLLKKKIDLQLHSISAIAHLGIDSIEKKTRSHETCSQMFIAALSIAAEVWKQTRCASTSEWLNKLWYNRTMEKLLSNYKEQAMDIHDNLGESPENDATWKSKF